MVPTAGPTASASHMSQRNPYDRGMETTRLPKTMVAHYRRISMAKRAYYFETQPLDPDHSAWHYFRQGVVEIEPEDLGRLEAELEEIGHSTIVMTSPVDEMVLDADAFRALIGEAIRYTHDNEYFDEAACDGDRPFLEAAASRADDDSEREALLTLSRGAKPKREWDDYDPMAEGDTEMSAD